MNRLQRILCGFFAITLTFTLTSCGDEQDTSDGDASSSDTADNYADTADDDHTDYEPENDADANDETEDTEPQDEQPEAGTEDPTLADAVIGGAADVTSDTIVIEGEEYAMPFKISEMTANGWDSPYLDSTTLDAGDAAAYDLTLEHNGAGKITAVMFQNTSDEQLTLRECDVIGLTLEGYGGELETVCSFVLPGGVTQNAKMSDFKSVYGEEDTENYLVEITEGDGYALTGRTGFSYDIAASFNRDGTISYVNIQCQGWTFA